MEKKYLEKIKKDNSWFWDSNKKYYLVCTDDLDSLLSCLLILMYKPNWQIGFYFNYREGLYKKIGINANANDSNVVFVDCSSIKQGVKCISNHLTSVSGEIYNENDINLNIIDGNSNDKHYFSKYNLSTFLLVVSLIEHKIDNLPGKILSLCLDSAYKAYYQPSNFADSKVQKRYLCNVLELEDIYNVQASISKAKFMQIVRDQNLNSKVWITDKGIRTIDNVDLGMICKYLNIDIDLSVLNGVFGMIEKSGIANKPVSYFKGKNLQESNITSFAITRRNNVSFSYKVIKP